MSKLSPVMSSIAMFFQTVVELASPSQPTAQVVPALKLAPGAGSVGVTSARTSKGAAKARSATKDFLVNILLLVSCLFFNFFYKVVNRGCCWSRRKRSAFFILEVSM